MSIRLAGRGRLLVFAAIFLLATPGLAGNAQSTPAAAGAAEAEELEALNMAAAINDAGPEGFIPVSKGLNFSLGTTSQHDSSNSWSSILNPNASYRFNRYFGVNAAVPVYGYINVYNNVATVARPVYAYNSRNGVFGDTALSFEGDASFLSMGYNGTVSMGLPSGKTDYGLGAGQVTYSISNHFEKGWWYFTPDIEFGFGDTSSLVEQRIIKSYVTVGPMAHFQAGSAVDLPYHCFFEANAYEELPLDNNIVYSTTGKGKKKVTTKTNTDPGEDNGFITSLDIPVAPNVILSGFYNRSLRDHNDVAGFSFTLAMKPPPRQTEPAQ